MEPPAITRGHQRLLTCTKANKSDSDIRLGISVDQLAAQGLAAGTIAFRLQLGLEGGSSGGVCDSGYSCAYTTNISWAGPRTPLPSCRIRASSLMSLFRGEDAGQTPEQLERRRRTRKSVLDHVLADAQRLQGRLGESDRRKLDEYLTAVRSVEQRLATAVRAAVAQASGRVTALRRASPQHGRPHGAGAVLRPVARRLVHVGQWPVEPLVLVHRRAGCPTSSRTTRTTPTRRPSCWAINTYELQVFAYLLDGLSRAKEGAGSLLDRT